MDAFEVIKEQQDDRTIFHIDIGTMDPEQRRQYLEQIKQEFRSKLGLPSMVNSGYVTST